MAVEQQVTISIDTILHGVEVVVIPIAGWLVRGAWHEMKELVGGVEKKIDGVDGKVDKVDGKVDELSTDLNNHKLATEGRLARVEAKVSSVFPKPS